MPKVSFILPAYKRRFLYEAIDSILAQTYQDFELIVVDDCSPENLNEIVDRFQDERLSYYRNETNIGEKDLVAAWNKALAYANGEWVVCAGDDDIYDPDFLTEMLALSRKYPTVDVFHCRIGIIDASGRILRLGRPRAEFERPIEFIYHSSVDRLEQRIPDFLYRRKVLCSYGGYVHSPRAWYSDIMTSIVMSLERGAVFSNRFLLFWRSSGENISCKIDDVPDKIEATVRFLTEIEVITSSLKPFGRDEQLLLEEIKSKVEKVALDSLWGYWSRMPFIQATKVLSNSRLPVSVRKAWHRIRLRQELGPTRLFSRVRQMIGWLKR